MYSASTNLITRFISVYLRVSWQPRLAAKHKVFTFNRLMGFFGDTLCTQPARSTANTTSGPMQFPSGQQFCFLPASLQFFSDLPPRSNNSSSCLPSRSNQFSLPASTQRPLPFSFCLRAANNSLHPAQQHFLPFFVCLRAAIIFFLPPSGYLTLTQPNNNCFVLLVLLLCPLRPPSTQLTKQIFRS